MSYQQKRRWTASQIQFMMDNYRTMKDEEIAYILGRTLKSVRNKRQRLEFDKESGGKGVFALPEPKSKDLILEVDQHE